MDLGELILLLYLLPRGLFWFVCGLVYSAAGFVTKHPFQSALWAAVVAAYLGVRFRSAIRRMRTKKRGAVEREI